MILCEQDLAEFGFSLDLAEQIAATLTDKDIELVIVDKTAMKAINLAQRGVNKATDVLSFPLKSVPSVEKPKSASKKTQSKNASSLKNSQNCLCGESVEKLPLGSIVINKDAVFKEATRLKHSTKAEFTLLFLHALLHLLGHDHEIDSGQMREKEAQIIARFKLPQSLIIRNEV